MSQTYYNLGNNATQLRPVGSPNTGLAKVLALASDPDSRILYVSSGASDLRRFVALLGDDAARESDPGSGIGVRHVGARLEHALAAQETAERRAARGLPDLDGARFTAVVCEVVASCVTDAMDWVRFIRRCQWPVFVAYRPHGVGTIVSKTAAQIAASEVGASTRTAMAKSDWDAAAGRRASLDTYPAQWLDDGDDCEWEDMTTWAAAVSAQHKRVSTSADTIWVNDVKDAPHFKALAEWVGAPLTEVQTLSELRYGGLSRLRATHDVAYARAVQAAEQHVDLRDCDEAARDAHASATGAAAAARADLFSGTRRLLALLPPGLRAAVQAAQPVTVTRADSLEVVTRGQRLVAQEGLYGGLLLAGRGWRSLWRHASGAAPAAPRVSLAVGVLERLGYVVADRSRTQAGGADAVRVSLVTVVPDMALGRRLEAEDSGQVGGEVDTSLLPYNMDVSTSPTNLSESSASNLAASAISVVIAEHTAAAAIYASRFPTSDADPLHARCLVYQPEAVEAALASRNTAGARVMTQKDQARGLAGAALVRTHSRPLPDGRMLLPIPPRAQWAEQREQARVEVTYLGGSRTSLQCVSREARRAMRPLAGYRFVSVDMVCAHLRIAEALCRVLSPSNKFFAKLFDGGDLYKSFGELTGLSREEAKKAAIMLLNGATDEGLLKEYPHLTPEACARAVEAWRKGNPWCTKTSHSIAGHAEAAARYQRVRGFKKRATDKGASTYTSLWLQMEENRMLQSALRELDGELQLVLPMYDGALFVVPDGQEEAAAAKAAAAFYRAAAACGYGRIEMKAGHGDTWGDAETNSTRRARP